RAVRHLRGDDAAWRERRHEALNKRIVIGHEMQRRVGEEEIRRRLRTPQRDVLLLECRRWNAQLRDVQHVAGLVDAENLGLWKAAVQEKRAVSRTAAEIDDELRLEVRDAREEVARRAGSLLLKFHIEFRIPVPQITSPRLR